MKQRNEVKKVEHTKKLKFELDYKYTRYMCSKQSYIEKLISFLENQDNKAYKITMDRNASSKNNGVIEVIFENQEVKDKLKKFIAVLNSTCKSNEKIVYSDGIVMKSNSGLKFSYDGVNHDREDS